jgi:hypothetical protein
MYKKLFFTSILAIVVMGSVSAQKAVTISAKELKSFIGCWQGTLNYSGTMIRKPFVTTAELVVKQLAKVNQFQFLHIYTKDPKENVADTITISKDGKKLNNGVIKSKRYTSEGDLEIITEVSGFDHDNNKPSIVRQTYRIGKKLYTYKKQVKLQGQEDWLDREDFNYSSKPCSTAPGNVHDFDRIQGFK